MLISAKENFLEVKMKFFYVQFQFCNNGPILYINIATNKIQIIMYPYLFTNYSHNKNVLYLRSSSSCLEQPH